METKLELIEHDEAVPYVYLANFTEDHWSYATGRQEPMEFDLTIPAGDHDPTKKFRLEKKSFAIVFHTPMAREQVMQHIQREFKEAVQYICVSSPQETSTSSPVMYIQIILHKGISKTTYFLRTVAGSQCNYNVTHDDRAWNSFTKEVGNCLEIGVFQSVRARTGPRGPKAKRQNHHGQRDLFTTKRLRAPIMTDERAADLATRRAMGLMKRSISTAIGLTQKQMPVQCLQQREALLKALNSLSSMAEMAIITQSTAKSIPTDNDQPSNQHALIPFTTAS